MAEPLEWSDVGARVRAARVAEGMSQESLGDAIGLDRTMIAKIEAGVRRLDALELARLGVALRLPIAHFLSQPPAVLSHRSELLDDSDTDAARSAFRLDAELGGWLRDVRQLMRLGFLQPARLWQYERAVDGSDVAREAASWLRDKLGVGISPLGPLVELAERAGQSVLVTEIAGDGASVIDDGVAVAVVNLRGDPGRRRATAAHELGHLVLGDEYSTDLGANTSRYDRERVVDAFAAEFLLPVEAVVSEWRADSAMDARSRLVRLAALYRTSWSLALRQAEEAKLVDGSQRRSLTPRSPAKAELRDAIGWVPQPDLDSIRVPPRYAHAVMEAWRAGAITSSRAVEMMRGQLEEKDLPARLSSSPN